MKTLHLETGRHLYGGPRQVLLLLAGLRARGVSATLACPAGSAIARAARAAGHPVVTHPLGGDLDVSAIDFLHRTVRRLQPDLLHAHSRRGADFFGGLAAARARIPGVLTRRVDSPDTPLVGTLKYRAFDRVVAVSEAVRAQLASQGVPPAKLRTIRSSIDPASCQPTWSHARLREEFRLDPAARVVVQAAQLIPRKGHALLLSAWPQVLKGCPDAHLLVLGTGPLGGALRLAASRAGLDHRVTFGGFRPDLLDFLGRADLLVHPASREGLGVSVLEAQAAGVPVVACGVGGLREGVADGLTGCLVPPENPAALAAAVLELLTHRALAQRMGAAAAHRIGRDFSPERMVSDYLSLYQELLT